MSGENGRRRVRGATPFTFASGRWACSGPLDDVATASIPVASPTNGPARPAHQHENKPNNQEHGSDGLKQADTSQDSDEEEDQSENYHAVSNLSWPWRGPMCGSDISVNTQPPLCCSAPRRHAGSSNLHARVPKSRKPALRPAFSRAVSTNSVNLRREFDNFGSAARTVCSRWSRGVYRASKRPSGPCVVDSRGQSVHSLEMTQTLLTDAEVDELVAALRPPQRHASDRVPEPDPTSS